MNIQCTRTEHHIQYLDYTNILHREDILAAKQALDTRPTQEPRTWILLRFLHFIMTWTCLNPMANLMCKSPVLKWEPNAHLVTNSFFMGKIETEFLRTQSFLPQVWWMLIDNNFMIWPHRREELNSFILAVNSYHETIKFTIQINDKTAIFSDTTVTKNEDDFLATTLNETYCSSDVYSI